MMFEDMRRSSTYLKEIRPMSKSGVKESLSFLFRTLKMLRFRHKAAVLATVMLGMILLPSLHSFTRQRYPGEHWKKASRPEALGWSSEKLQLAKEHFEKKKLTDKDEFSVVESCIERVNAIQPAIDFKTLRENSLALIPIYEDLTYTHDCLIDWEMDEMLDPYVKKEKT